MSFCQIRTTTLRGRNIPEWLLLGAEYGEESPTLEVDSIMVRVANLRAMSLTAFCGTGNDTDFAVDPHQLKIIAGDADQLNIALTSWSETVPDDWKFSTQYSPESSASLESDFLYEGTSHIYTSPGHAVIWNRYRALRLIVNSICLRSLSLLLEFIIPCRASMRPVIISQQETCRRNLDSLATELCYSVPFFFRSPIANGGGIELSTTKIGSPPASTESEILPKMAGLLAWPIAVAIRTEGIPEVQREWLKRRLKLAAVSMGDAMLETVIDSGEFKF